MAEAASAWYSKLRWEDHFLDILLIGWCGWCCFVVLVINSFVAFVGPLQRRLPLETIRETGGKAVVKGATVETCQWFNTALNWFYLHYYHPADFNEEWIKALNEQITKLGGPVQTKFEKIQSGSLPPKFSEVSCEAAPEDKFIIHARTDSRDLAFTVFASQQTHEGVKLTNCTATVLKLRGMLLVKAYREGGDVKITVSFAGRPDIKVNVQPTNPYQDPSDLVDLGVVEEVVRNAISLTSTTFIVTQWFFPEPGPITHGTGQDRSRGQGHGHSFGQPPPSQSHDKTIEYRAPQTHSSTAQNAPRKAPGPPSQSLPQNQAVFEPIVAETYQSAFYAPSSAGVPPKPPRYVGDKRLLVKIIKANGIGAKEVGSVDPVVLILMDDPIQNHSTSIVKNTSNPFWDEHFLFDVTQNTNELRFEVFDKAKSPGEDFLGESTVYIEDLRRTPSSRQILSLQSRPGNMDYITGSLTVEFLFMDSAEAEMMFDMSQMPSSLPNSQFSPKRRIETERTITPGGTVVTTTTTTTQKPQYGRLEAGVDDYQEEGRGIPTIESTPTEEPTDSPLSSHTSTDRPQSVGASPDKDKKKMPFWKRFGRGKKRSHSADRAASSLKEGSNYLRPPEQTYGPQSKDDMELVRSKEPPKSPNLKKSRSLGGSLKKLFRRSRKRSKSRGETSRDSSFSRSSGRNPTSSQGPSRDSSLNRHSAQQRSSVS